MRMIADGFVLKSQFHGRARRRGGALAQAACGRARSIRVRATVLETRASKSRPDMGFVKFLFEMLDEQGAVLTTLTSPLMVARRAAGSAAMKYFEDIAVGERVAVGRHTFTADEIKAFAARFDPQPFHVDEAAAETLAFRRALSPPAGTPRWSGCG